VRCYLPSVSRKLHAQPIFHFHQPHCRNHHCPSASCNLAVASVSVELSITTRSLVRIPLTQLHYLLAAGSSPRCSNMPPATLLPSSNEFRAAVALYGAKKNELTQHGENALCKCPNCDREDKPLYAGPIGKYLLEDCFHPKQQEAIFEYLDILGRHLATHLR